MKPSSPVEKRKTISRAKAKSCALLNLAATPGLGSLAVGRWVAGAGQLVLALVGFTLFLIWFIKIISQSGALWEFSQPVEVKPVGWIGLTGVIFFAAAWVWSAFTSLDVSRQARESEVEELKQQINAPPIMHTSNNPQVQAGLASLPQWKQKGSAITRTFQFKNFPEAIDFVNAIKPIAEAVNHHPDIDIRWNKVTLTLTTHDAGGLTDKDFSLAKQIDAL